MPLITLFHAESNRIRRGPDDLGLEDEDLTAADGVVRHTRQQKDHSKPKDRHSIVYDNIKITKGDFVFPHRTYRPKVQVAFRVPTGQAPQAVVMERLHRLYRKSDINLVLQQLGVELEDLVPPLNYGENNERFYHEAMFRSRIKINGVDKKEFLQKKAR